MSCDHSIRYRVVQSMRSGMSPTDAVKEALEHIASYYPSFNGAMIAVNVNGDYGKRERERERERKKERKRERAPEWGRIQSICSFCVHAGGGGHGFSPFPATVYNPVLDKSTVIDY